MAQSVYEISPETEKMPSKPRWIWAMPLCIFLSCALFGAHLMRSGGFGPAAACVGWAAACLSRKGWMRPVTVLVLTLMGLQWFVVTGNFIVLRLQFEMPWIRLAVILGSVALFSLVSAALTAGSLGQRWFSNTSVHDWARALAFLLTIALMVPAERAPYPILLADRFFPGSGMLQMLLAGLWAAWVCGCLIDHAKASKTRMFVWPLFSTVFFFQFALSALGFAIVSMHGNLHIPVPGVILGGAAYRLSPGFMLFLFLFSVLLAGPAWCSHLCYFGSWDALAAMRRNPAKHPHPVRWRVLMLGLTVCTALVLRLAGAPVSIAAACGIALGLAMLPVSLCISGTKGLAIYCTMICPLGLVSCLLGKLSFWRVRTTRNCTGCGTCLKHCRYGALTPENLKAGRPGVSCTLCRECVTHCPRQGMAVSFAGKGLLNAKGTGEGWAGTSFVTLVSALHAAFLFMAMV